MAHKKGSNAGSRRSGRRKGYYDTLFGRHTELKTRLSYAAGGLGVLAGIAVVIVALYAVLLIPLAPSLKELESARAERPGKVLAADGEEIAQLQRIPRTWVALKDISPHAVDALVAAEDHRFYAHGGVDMRRMFTASVRTLFGDSQGASTLPMQLARNLFPEEIGQSPALTRKLKEIITAYKIEKVFTKDEIIEAYLNSVPFLYNAFGIERGARTYFGKPASELDVVESATLIGMLKGTWYYNPVLHPKRAKNRRNVVLAQMVKRGKLDAGSYEELKSRPVGLDFEPLPVRSSQAPHFTEMVRRTVKAWADENGYDIYADGLVVHTTLDAGLQKIATQAVQQRLDALQAVVDVEWGRPTLRLISGDAGAYKGERNRVEPFGHFWNSKADLVNDFIRSTPRFKTAVDAGKEQAAVLNRLRRDGAFMDSLRAVKTRLETGFVALDPRTGHVKAWVGSRSYGRDQFDHVGLARRQPGSTFKPFVYATALEQGYSPEDRFWDQEVEIPIDGDQVWRPTNAEGVSGREMTLREALAQSKNTVTAQLIYEIGPKRVAELARDMGVNKSELDPVPSLALGASAVTLLEMVSAYGTIASGGTYHEPLYITRIDDARGHTLVSFENGSEDVLPEETALTLIDMMRGVINDGTGQRIRSVFGIEADVAGKTGTTQDNADGWFILMHPDLVAGAWVGFNDQRITFRSNYWGQGAHNALYVVGDVFRKAAASGELRPGREFPPPPLRRFEDDHDSWFDRLEGWFGRTIERAIGDRSGEESRRETRRERTVPDAPNPPRSPESPGREDRRERDERKEDDVQQKRRERLERALEEVERMRKRARERIEESQKQWRDEKERSTPSAKPERERRSPRNKQPDRQDAESTDRIRSDRRPDIRKETDSQRAEPPASKKEQSERVGW